MNLLFPLILNGKKPGKAEVKQFVNALSDPKILNSTGGYLFKTCLADGELHIGIAPAISEGERLHHYDIKVPDSEHLIGGVSATGEISLLFRADKTELNDIGRAQWKLIFCSFAAGLLDRGYTGKGQLDWITRQIIQESEIFKPVPETLKDIDEICRRN